MNILVHTSDFPPQPGGIAAFLQHVCEELARLGHNVKVLAHGKHEIESGYDLRQPFSVCRYRLPARMSAGVVIAQTLYHSRRHKTNVILQGLFSSTHGLGLVVSRWLSQVPYTVLVHGFDILDAFGASRMDRWSSHLILHSASIILANSQDTKRKIEQLGYSKKPIHIVNPAVDPDVFHPGIDTLQLCKRHKLEGRRIILTVSRLVAKKNHAAILKALVHVIEEVPDLLCLIVGKGEQEERLKSMTYDLKLSENVIFVGYVEPSNTPPYFAACDVYVMPSKTVGLDFESFGIAYVEASACGKPVIAGNSGGTADAVVDGVTGLLVDPDNVMELSRAIVRLLTDRNYASKLGENGRRRVEEELNWDAAGKRIEGILKKIATSSVRN